MNDAQILSADESPNCHKILDDGKTMVQRAYEEFSVRIVRRSIRLFGSRRSRAKHTGPFIAELAMRSWLLPMAARY